MFQVRVITQRVTKIRAEVLILGVFHDVRPLTGFAGEVDWIHNGILSHLILKEKFSGKVGETILVATQRKLPASKVLVVGLGQRKDFDYARLQRISKVAFNTIHQLKTKQSVMEIFGLSDCPLDGTKAVESIRETIRGVPFRDELDVTLLVPDEDKLHQIRQRLSYVSVAV